MIAGFPKWLVVAVVLGLGVAVFFMANPPHRLCQAQIAVFQEQQKAQIFPGQGKVLARSPRVIQQVENCKLGNTPGACFELFSILRKLNRDLQGMPNECIGDLQEIGIIRGSLQEGMALLVEVAWGEGIPEQSVGGIQQGWLEAADIALFCGMRDTFTRLYGKEALDQFRMAIFRRLPGEQPVLEDGACKNCEFRRLALQMLSPEEVWARSLFAARCELFR